MRDTPSISTLREVLDSKLLKGWRCAIDGGAFVGEWSSVMAERFDVVHAFEPCAESFEQLRAAVPPHVTAHRCALWESDAMVNVVAPAKRTTRESRYVTPDAAGTVRAIALDSLDLPACDLLKLDLEGAEYFALRGALRTIKRHKPVLIIEMNNRARRHYGVEGLQMAELLSDMDYKLAWSREPDMVFRPKC